MPQFDINTYYSQIFWLIIIFGFLYLLVYKFISPTAEKIFSNRKDNIENNIVNADQLASKAQKLKEDYDTEVSKISSIVETVRKDAISALDSSFSSKKIKLHNELKEQLKKNLDNIDSTTKLFWLNENDSCINLATVMIEKITSRQADLALLKECYRKMK